MEDFILYRGDRWRDPRSLKETQDPEMLPQQYANTGLWTRSAVNSGDPSVINRQSTLDLISFHIFPDSGDSKETRVYETSNFISFSRCEKTAISFMNQEIGSAKANRDVERYLHRFELPEPNLSVVEPGIWEFEYPSRFYLDVFHSFVIIESAAYLNRFAKDMAGFIDFDQRVALANAEKEYLVLPSTPMTHQSGFLQASILPFSTWKTKVFAPGELEKDSNF